MTADSTPLPDPKTLIAQREADHKASLKAEQDERRRCAEQEAEANRDRDALMSIEPDHDLLDKSQGLTRDEQYGLATHPRWAPADHPGWGRLADAHYLAIDVVRRRGLEGRLDAPLTSDIAAELLVPLSILLHARKGQATRGELIEALRTAYLSDSVGWIALRRWTRELMQKLFPEIVAVRLGKLCPRCHQIRRPDEFPPGAFGDPGRLPQPCKQCGGSPPAPAAPNPEPLNAWRTLLDRCRKERAYLEKSIDKWRPLPPVTDSESFVAAITTERAFTLPNLDSLWTQMLRLQPASPPAWPGQPQSAAAALEALTTLERFCREQLDERQKAPAKEQENGGSYIVFVRERTYTTVGGNREFFVSDDEDGFLQAFLERPTMDTAEIRKVSGLDDAQIKNVVRGLAGTKKTKPKYDGVFAKSIDVPGGKGKGGYHVRIRKKD